MVKVKNDKNNQFCLTFVIAEITLQQKKAEICDIYKIKTHKQ